MALLTASLLALSAFVSPYAACGAPTGASATVLVAADVSLSHPKGAVESGDQIAAIAPDGSCAGVVTWDGDGAALTVWVDDPFTEEREGMIPGEPVALSVWDASTGESHTSDVLGVKLKAPYGEAGAFAPDELYVLEGITGTSAPDEPQQAFSLDQSYPNPASRRTTVSFSTDARETVVLEVFDALGRQVSQPLDGELPAGQHTVVLDVSGLASGVYVYRLRTATRSLQNRLTVSR